MQKIVYYFYIVLCLLCITTTTSAQEKVAVSGFVKDAENSEALMRATVQIFNTDTTKLISGAVTNNIGGFTVKNVSQGKYIMKVVYLGYHNYFKTIELKKGTTTFSAGTILMIPNSVALQDAVVTGVLQQVEVKEDSVVFNADAYKVPEGSVLEDLVKKLPGAEVDDDGNITINGKKVNKIMVKGKEFFNNNTEMAMKNLSSDLIEKIKVYDKKSDLSRITGIDDGEEETVLDLTFKKNSSAGWFGNINGGIGTNSLYSSRAVVSRMTDNSQLNFIGNLNNTNNNGTRTNNNGGLRLDLDLKKVEINGNVSVATNKNDNWNKYYRQNLAKIDTLQYTDGFSANKSSNKSINGNFKIEWKIDTLTTLLFRPNFTFSTNDSYSNRRNASFQLVDPQKIPGITSPREQLELIPDSVKLNSNRNGNTSDGNNNNISGNILFNRKLNQTGRNVSLRANFNWSDNKSDNYNSSIINYFQIKDDNKKNDFVYRYRKSPNKNLNYSIGFTYSEPLSKELILQANYNYSYSERESDSKTFDMGKWYIRNLNIQDSLLNNLGYLPSNYQQSISDSLSRFTNDQNTTHNIELSLRWFNSHVNMWLGVLFQPQHQKMQFAYLGHDTIASRDFFRITPTLNFRYRFSKQKSFRLWYRGNITQPDITNLFDWDDDSNPMRTRRGNPNLKPSYNNNINFQYNNYVTARMQNWNVNLQYQGTSNSVTDRVEYVNDGSGRTITTPENINGNWSINGNFGFGSPLFVERFIINTNSYARYNHNVGLIYDNIAKMTYNNKVNENTLGERLSLRYRASNWDIEAFGNIHYTKSESEHTQNQEIYSFGYGLSSNGNFDNGFGYWTNINMSSRRGYAQAEANTNELIWNAQLSYRFLTGKRASVSVQAFDILKQRTNISRSISAMSISDNENSGIYNYYMLRFSYRFNIFGSKDAKRNERDLKRFENSGM